MKGERIGKVRVVPVRNRSVIKGIPFCEAGLPHSQYLIVDFLVEFPTTEEITQNSCSSSIVSVFFESLQL